jgi:hypothetical protein
MKDYSKFADDVQRNCTHLAGATVGACAFCIAVAVGAEVARLTIERDEMTARAINAEKQATGIKEERKLQDREVTRLHTALEDVNNLLTSVPQDGDCRKLVREKVVDVLFGEPAWKTGG